RNRCRAADDDAGADGEPGQHGVADRAGRVVEIDVDAIRRRRRELVLEVCRLVVDGAIVTEVLDANPALGRAAGDADGAAAGDFGDLADGRTDRSGRGRDDDGVAGFWPPEVE